MILKQKLHLKIAFLPSPFTMVFGHEWKIRNFYTIYSSGGRSSIALKMHSTFQYTQQQDDVWQI
jgi:hypothetical protein